jgi:hypothetical protein
VISNVHLQRDRPMKNPYDTKPGEKPYKLEIVWPNVLVFIYLHSAALYAITLHVEQKLTTYFISECLMVLRNVR